MENFDQQHIIHATVENLVFLHKILFKRLFKRKEDVLIAHSDVADATFNYVINAKFTKDNVEKRIRETLSYFPPHVPYIWWTAPTDTPMNLQEHLIANGLVCQSDDPGMWCDLSQVAATHQKSELHIKRVLDQESLKAFSDISSKVSEHELFYDYLLKYLSEEHYGNDSPLEFFVGYYKNTPVTTGLLVLHAGVAGIYYIATLSETRGKGFGSDMVHYLQLRAKTQGMRFATLQAAKDGVKIYQRHGFKECCYFQEYVPNIIE